VIDRRRFLLWTTALMTDAVRPVQAASATPIRMAYFENYAPLSFRDAHGQMAGALIDGVELMGHAAGLSFTHEGFPWVRAQAMVESGKQDGFCTTIDLVRQAYADFCPTPIIVEHFCIYHRIDDKRMHDLHSIQDLRPLIQGGYRGSGYPLRYLEAQYFHWYKDVDTVLRMVDNGNLDVYVGSETVTSHKLKELGLTDRISATPAPFMPAAEFCFGLRHHYPNAADVLAQMEAATSAARKSGALDKLLKPYR
jgi:polar amino acid transport system substrate-binding protein